MREMRAKFGRSREATVTYESCEIRSESVRRLTDAPPVPTKALRHPRDKTALSGRPTDTTDTRGLLFVFLCEAAGPVATKQSWPDQIQSGAMLRYNKRPVG